MRSSTTRPAALFFAWLFLIALTLPGYTANLHYLEETGRQQTEIDWQIEGERSRLSLAVAKSNGQIYTSRHDETGAVIQWHLQNLNQDTDIVARREGNRILIGGKVKGKTVVKKIAIDEAPWYQTVSFALTTFAASEDTSVTFWALRTDTLTPHKMRAMKTGVETISFQKKEIETQKIRVKLTGFKAMFWHSDYWLKKDNGLFLRYEGIEGPPGTPPTIVTLVTKLP
ncbi:hypothetical protein ACFL5X_00455 [Candidatus Omnitrophota bacterium]